MSDKIEDLLKLCDAAGSSWQGASDFVTKFNPVTVRALLECLRDARAALKAECSCPGEFDYHGNLIKCDACEALDKITKEFE